MNSIFNNFIPGQKGEKVTSVYFHWYGAPDGYHDPKVFESNYVDNTNAVNGGVFTVRTPGVYYLEFYAYTNSATDMAYGQIKVNGSYKAMSLNFS